MEDRPPERWEEGCQHDAIRNGFVIPYIVKIIRFVEPDVVGDIGCGTGYMTRSVRDLLSLTNIQWHLLDCNPAMLKYAREKCAHIEGAAYHEFDLCAVTHAKTMSPVAMGFVAYTYLDIQMTRQVAINTAGLVKPNGHLLVFTPDVLEDVEQAMAENSDMLTHYRHGLCSIIEKQDKFTGQKVTFRANRTETVLEFLLAAGLQLLHIETYRAAGDKLHYCFLFRKPDQAQSFS